MWPSIVIFKPDFCTDYRKYAKERGLKIDTDVVLYEEQDGRVKVVGSAAAYGVGGTDPDESQRCFHGFDLKRLSSSDLSVLKAAVIHKDSFSIPYIYRFRWISIYEVKETLADVSKFELYVWDLQVMKVIENKSNESASNNSAENTKSCRTPRWRWNGYCRGSRDH